MNETITEQDIARLRALCDGATPGPWDRALDLVPEGYALVAANEPTKSLLSLDPDDMAIFERPADAEFCAAARECLPRLLDEVERLKREAYAWGGELENYRAMCTLLGRDTTTDWAHDDLDAAMCLLRDAGHGGKDIDRAVADLVTERGEARAEVERLNKRVEFTHDCYSVRIRRLEDLCTEKGLRHEWACIVANGVGDVHEQPLYAQRLNLLKFDVDKLRAENASLKAELARMGRAKEEARADEREACAKVIENMWITTHMHKRTCADLAALIRAKASGGGNG